MLTTTPPSTQSENINRPTSNQASSHRRVAGSQSHSPIFLVVVITKSKRSALLKTSKRKDQVVREGATGLTCCMEVLLNTQRVHFLALYLALYMYTHRKTHAW